jgi:hypothetical protein
MRYMSPSPVYTIGEAEVLLLRELFESLNLASCTSLWCLADFLMPGIGSSTLLSYTQYPCRL